MPTATYEELLIETLPQVIETEVQYHRIARRFGDLVGKGRGRSAEETKLLRLLALLVEDYDRRHGFPGAISRNRSGGTLNLLAVWNSRFRHVKRSGVPRSSPSDRTNRSGRHAKGWGRAAC